MAKESVHCQYSQQLTAQYISSIIHNFKLTCVDVKSWSFGSETDVRYNKGNVFDRNMSQGWGFQSTMRHVFCA